MSEAFSSRPTKAFGATDDVGNSKVRTTFGGGVVKVKAGRYDGDSKNGAHVGIPWSSLSPVWHGSVSCLAPWCVRFVLAWRAHSLITFTFLAQASGMARVCTPSVMAKSTRYRWWCSPTYFEQSAVLSQRAPRCFSCLTHALRRVQGDWIDDKRSGTGEEIWPDDRHYFGEWKNDAFHGTGTFTWPGDLLFLCSLPTFACFVHAWARDCLAPSARVTEGVPINNTLPLVHWYAFSSIPHRRRVPLAGPCSCTTLSRFLLVCLCICIDA